MPLDFPSTDAQPTPICPSILPLPQQATSQKPYSVNPISGTPSTKHFFRPLERHQGLPLRNVRNCIFLKCCQSVTANRTATVKENCSFGLLFDHSRYVEAAAASIRATGQSRPRHTTIPTAAQPSDSRKSCASLLPTEIHLSAHSEAQKDNRHPIGPKYHCTLHYIPLFCLKVHFGIPFYRL